MMLFLETLGTIALAAVAYAGAAAIGRTIALRRHIMRRVADVARNRRL